jgi:hypothetical protein
MKSLRARTAVVAVTAAAIVLLVAPAVAPRVATQSGPTLVGEWATKWAPINGQLFSKMGNSLGFPDRDMFFGEEGDLRTGFVDREDAGPDVKPLGVWRINGNHFSATFQLWCPDNTQPCGSIVMRGEFTSDDRFRGTATAFFDEKDPTSPTGYDSLAMSFQGVRVSGGSQ